MEVKPSFKQTVIGVMPESWGVVLLDTVAKRGSGHTPDKKHPEYWNGSIKWVSLQDSAALDNLYIEDSAATITPAGIANSSAVLHPAGTVVLSRDAGVGKSAIMKEEMAVSQHFMAWQCGSKLDNHFLYYWLQARKSEFERIANGSTIKTIGLPYFRTLCIQLPELLEQRAIATALSDIDALLAAQDKLIAKKRNIKQATMQQLLTGKRRLPGFSGEWEVKRLGDVATVLKGSGLSKGKVSQAGSSKCVLYGELFTTYSRIITEVCSSTDFNEGLPSVYGDVLLPGSTTTVGIDLATASALLCDGVLLGGDINVVRAKGLGYSPEFLAYLLTEEKRNQIADMAQGITIIHLYGKSLLQLELCLPSLEEQTAIATVFSDMDTKLAALEQQRDKTRALKQGMMQELLTGRIRLV